LAFHNAIRKYGIGNFKIDIIPCDARSISDAEQATIAGMRVIGIRLYNLTGGGEGVAGLKVSLVTRAKLRAANLGKKMSPDNLVKLIAKNKGRKKSPEVRARMSAARIGMKFSPEHCANIGRAKAGCHLTEEHKQKLRLAMVGRVFTPEWRAKISNAKKGVFRKDQCSHGHPFKGNNVRLRPTGGRACRECKRQEARKRYWEKKREAFSNVNI